MSLVLLLVVALFSLVPGREAELSVRPGAQADSVTLAWDASPSEGVTGYVVEYGTSAGNYTQTYPVANVTQETVGQLQPGVTYYFIVRAQSAEGTSPPSNEVVFVPQSAPPPPPPPPPPTSGCAPVQSDVSFGLRPVTIVVNSYDTTTTRSDPRGMLVRFDASSSEPIVRIELDLEGDNEPAVPLNFPTGLGFDGRYVRGLAFKPTVNGTWPLLVTATDATGRVGQTRCLPGVTVTETSTPPPPPLPHGIKRGQ